MSQASGVSTAGSESVVKSTLSRISSRSTDWLDERVSGLCGGGELSKLPPILLFLPELRRTIVKVPCSEMPTITRAFVILYLMEEQGDFRLEHLVLATR